MTSSPTWAKRVAGLAALCGMLMLAPLAQAQQPEPPPVAEAPADAPGEAPAAVVPAEPDATPAEEAEAEPTAAQVGEVAAYVDNSYLFLIGGIIVMFMAAGFCMLEAGLVRAKNAATQATKNVMLYSVAGLMVYVVGYHLIYPAGGWAVSFGSGAEDTPNYGVLAGFNIWDFGDRSGTNELSYAKGSDWFFQMVFVATAASVVSGTLAERIKIWPFMLFTAVLTGFIYPIQASWQWGAGWLSDIGFSDFAGSTLVHSTGGWAALAGALILGPRLGKYVDGKVVPMPGSNIPLAALGTFILWFGWFGFNGASQLAAGTVGDINAVANIFVNTNTAAAAGVVAAMLMTTLLYRGKMDATLVLNGAIGGLVAITASPLNPEVWESIVIGGIGGVLVVLAVPMLDKFKIDDVVGAIPAHLVCGIWGTLAVAWNAAEVTNEAGEFVTYGFSMDSLISQLIGIGAIGAFVFVASTIVWLVLKFTIGIRASEEEELEGLDLGELGLEAYPEFKKA